MPRPLGVAREAEVVKKYIVRIGGIDHTMQLTEADALRLAATPISKRPVVVPTRRSRRTDNKGVQPKDK